VDGRFVADGEFVVPGRDRPMAFEPVDAALHGVPVAVVGPGRAWAAGRPRRLRLARWRTWSAEFGDGGGDLLVNDIRGFFTSLRP